MQVQFDDSIVQDIEAEKRQDMAEIAAGLMGAWEYRMRWYGEDKETAKLRAGGVPYPASSSLGQTCL